MTVTKRRNRINGQFSPRLAEMLESPAYRVLSRSGHMVISRVEIELACHGGNDNGKLPVTTDDFVEYGMHRSSVAPAIREVEALGFVRVKRGRGGNAEYRSPNLFFLTFAQARDSHKNPPTHDWRRINTLHEAETIARRARSSKNPAAIAQGKSSWLKRNAGTEKRSASVRLVRTETENAPVRKISPTASGEKAEPLSIARVGERDSGPRRIVRSRTADTDWTEDHAH